MPALMSGVPVYFTYIKTGGDFPDEPDDSTIYFVESEQCLYVGNKLIASVTDTTSLVTHVQLESELDSHYDLSPASNLQDFVTYRLNSALTNYTTKTYVDTKATSTYDNAVSTATSQDISVSVSGTGPDVSNVTYNDSNKLLTIYRGDTSELYLVNVTLTNSTQGSSNKSATEIISAVTSGKVPIAVFQYGSLNMFAIFNDSFNDPVSGNTVEFTNSNIMLTVVGSEVSVQTITDSSSVADQKMDKIDPTGTGSFSLNRMQDTTIGNYSFAEGYETTASGVESHSEGYQTTASNSAAHSEGYQTQATGIGSHSEGRGTYASGQASHAEGYETVAIQYCSHAEGGSTTASGSHSHAEGSYATASGGVSHAEGASTEASGDGSHAEGEETTASGYNSHSEGWGTTASGQASHSEGYYTTASGNFAHAEGAETTASGNQSHAEGVQTVATSNASHSAGVGTIASSFAQTAIGKFNIEDSSNDYAFILGNGEKVDDETISRSNALTIDWSGNVNANGTAFPLDLISDNTSTTSVPKNTWTEIEQIPIGPGTYIIMVSGKFNEIDTGVSETIRSMRVLRGNNDATMHADLRDSRVPNQYVANTDTRLKCFGIYTTPANATLSIEAYYEGSSSTLYFAAYYDIIRIGNGVVAQSPSEGTPAV